MPSKPKPYTPKPTPQNFPPMKDFNRREFIKKSAFATAGAGLFLSACAGGSQSQSSLDKDANATSPMEPLFKISLAQWSLNRSLFAGKLDNLDFAAGAKAHGIDAIEYVNQFFMDKAEDKAYLKEMKDRADSEGVTSVLIMCDNEGALGDPDAAKRSQTVENHKKWVQAAQYLGCHSIRVNGYSGLAPRGELDPFEESQKLVADGLRQLCEYADPYDINVIIENHGGNSSNAKWLTGVMDLADHVRAGTLPDFGNFQIHRDGDKVTSYDAYRGVQELMPYAKGVSVKTIAWDDKGNSSPLDYDRMMRIVLDAGWRGYCGIEHGEEGREWEAITEVRDKLIASRERLAADYK
jgi:sugar phosphate isomerase/epimerase